MSAWIPRLTLHSLAILASLLVYILTTRAQRERRPPSIAIAWVLGMIAVPYLALPLYLMFGRRKVQRRFAARPVAGASERRWAEVLIESFGLPPAASARVRLHRDGVEARDALWALIEGALQRLDLCTYIFADDDFGREAQQRLIGCARRGVRVRVMVDGVGALRWRRRQRRALEAAGIETAIFSPLLARRTGGPRNLRNHRKLVIADGAQLWAGGRNLANEYFLGSGTAAPWLDLSFDLQGAVAAAAAAQFEADWRASNGRPGVSSGMPTALPERSRAQFLPSGPDQSEDTVHALLLDACFRAERRLLAVTPYFVPDTSFATALRLAARRGVEIDICLPARSNHVLADFARSRPLRALADAGAAIHLLPAMLHAKAIVFDDTLAVCGSPNLDSRSLLLNYESAFVFYGATEIEWLSAWINALLPQCTPFSNKAPGLLRDLGEGLLLTMAYQL